MNLFLYVFRRGSLTEAFKIKREKDTLIANHRVGVLNSSRRSVGSFAIGGGRAALYAINLSQSDVSLFL